MRHQQQQMQWQQELKVQLARTAEPERSRVRGDRHKTNASQAVGPSSGVVLLMTCNACPILLSYLKCKWPDSVIPIWAVGLPEGCESEKSTRRKESKSKWAETDSASGQTSHRQPLCLEFFYCPPLTPPDWPFTDNGMYSIHRKRVRPKMVRALTVGLSWCCPIENSEESTWLASPLLHCVSVYIVMHYKATKSSSVELIITCQLVSLSFTLSSFCCLSFFLPSEVSPLFPLSHSFLYSSSSVFISLFPRPLSAIRLFLSLSCSLSLSPSVHFALLRASFGRKICRKRTFKPQWRFEHCVAL